MNWRLLVLGGTGLAAAGAGAYLLKRKLDEETPDVEPEGSDDYEAPVPQPENTGGDMPDANPPPLGDSRWGKVPKDFQTLVTRTQLAARIPYLWVFGSICANRESSFVLTAHNQDEEEVDGSRRGIENGLKRGNPKPKFAEQAKAFGSGGLFGALASSFVWVGLDEGHMPFLLRKPETVFQAGASCVFLAHYFWRVTSPRYANGRKLNMFDVRVGWASPTLLKNKPFSPDAEQVRKRMREDIAKLGWDEEWVASLPVVRKPYTGIKAVATSFDYSPGQED